MLRLVAGLASLLVVAHAGATTPQMPPMEFRYELQATGDATVGNPFRIVATIHPEEDFRTKVVLEPSGTLAVRKAPASPMQLRAGQTVEVAWEVVATEDGPWRAHMQHDSWFGGPEVTGYSEASFGVLDAGLLGGRPHELFLAARPAADQPGMLDLLARAGTAEDWGARFTPQLRLTFEDWRGNMWSAEAVGAHGAPAAAALRVRPGDAGGSIGVHVLHGHPEGYRVSWGCGFTWDGQAGLQDHWAYPCTSDVPAPYFDIGPGTSVPPALPPQRHTRTPEPVPPGLVADAQRPVPGLAVAMLVLTTGAAVALARRR